MYNYEIEFDASIGRYVAKYDNDMGGVKVSMKFVAPDWAVNKFGVNPKKLELVDEVQEIFDLNYLFSASLASEQAKQTAQKSQGTTSGGPL